MSHIPGIAGCHTLTVTESYRSIALRGLGVVGADWTLRDGETWCMVTPPRRVHREQGWKLHLSATLRSAPQVLENAAGVLSVRGCAFKFAVSPRVTVELTSARAARAQSGKFLTVYPDSDDQLPTLAEELHERTLGLAGPAILSDRRYRPGSLVHYRYGCFAAARELNDEGLYESRLRAPDGSLVTDQRNPWFSPPPWAPPPFPPPRRSNPGRPHGAPTTVAGRYNVREAIRHSNRGGVYRARDLRTGEDVLLKEARPHVATDRNGRDARHWLRHEADVLTHLAPLRLAPAVRDVFESAEHLFLVEDLVGGENLQQWSSKQLAGGNRIPVSTARALARELTRLVGEVHTAGFVLRDLKPSNVVMTPENQPLLVDLECAVRTGEAAEVVGTHGFTDPSYLDGPDNSSGQPPPAPGPEADCYSLGATLLHTVTGMIPLLAEDRPRRRAAGERLKAIVDAAAPSNPTLRALAPLVIGLTADPPDRWALGKATAFLWAESVHAPALPPGTTSEPERQGLTADRADQLLTDGLAHLAATAEPAAEYLWPWPRKAPQGDPCSVQLGAAGVLAVLDRAVRCGETSAEPTLRTAARWLDECLTKPGRILPGLYFGRSGTAWALHDAARTLGDQQLAGRAKNYALNIPLDWSNPDICHGLAGAGLAQLHLWHATGDHRFAERSSQCADRLLHLTSNKDSGVDWPIGAQHRRELAGSALYGFGHGLAGHAAFLLAAGRVLDRPELVEIAAAAGHVLCAVAEVHEDAADWPKGPRRGERTDLNFWCHGAAGIGTFLVRLWQATADPRFRTHAEYAANAAHRDRWRVGPSTCHGAAGNGQLLLDLADATGDQHHRARAAEIATCLYTRATWRDGRLLVPDETLRDISASYHTGLAGTLDFLLRLKHGGNRSWLVDTDQLAGEPHEEKGNSHGDRSPGTAGTARGR
ncbi:class IV lanthionine synthetase LanL [Streptomyces sp. NPDC101150]|uniref:class IV lanthionine synthetase LanL n=1 Tax=Streptomyces sp. NPDC101150 TaxID=3366114 RepID=UPI0038058E9F